MTTITINWITTTTPPILRCTLHFVASARERTPNVPRGLRNARDRVRSTQGVLMKVVPGLVPRRPVRDRRVRHISRSPPSERPAPNEPERSSLQRLQEFVRMDNVPNARVNKNTGAHSAQELFLKVAGLRNWVPRGRTRPRLYERQIFVLRKLRK